MNSVTFNALIEDQIKLSKDILTKKSDEYSDNDDRLHNFRVAAQLENTTMRVALGGMMAKHTISIYDMIRAGKNHTLEQWEEKVLDHINYLLLLRAVVEEEHLKQAAERAIRTSGSQTSNSTHPHGVLGMRWGG